MEAQIEEVLQYEAVSAMAKPVYLFPINMLITYRMSQAGLLDGAIHQPSRKVGGGIGGTCPSSS